jgi:histidinol-phosphatase (PHP family)
MREIEILQTKFNGKINIFKSIEADFIPFYTYSFKYLKENWNLDYIIGSIHLVRNPVNEKLLFIDGGIENFQRNLKVVFNGNVKKAVENYYLQSIEMIKSENPDIIAHLDKIIINSSKLGISEKSDWYISLIDELLMEIKNQNTIVEINTRAKYQAKWHDTNPGEKIIRKLISKNIPIIISTDAHKPAQLNLLYQETRNRLKNLNLKSQMRFVNNKWEEKKI